MNGFQDICPGSFARWLNGSQLWDHQRNHQAGDHTTQGQDEILEKSLYDQETCEDHLNSFNLIKKTWK